MDEPHNSQQPQLYRSEAIEYRASRWLPEIRLERSSGLIAVTIGSIAAAALLLVVVIWGTYHRRLPSEGFVMPRDGIAQVHSSIDGVLVALDVHEGSIVKRDELMGLVSSAKTMSGGGSVDDAIANTLRDRLRMLKDDRAHSEKLLATRTAAAREQGIALDDQIKSIAAENELTRQRVAIAEGSVSAYEELKKTGYIAGGFAVLSQKKDDLLHLRTTLEQGERTLRRLRAERERSKRDETELKQSALIVESKIDRDVLEIEQQLMEVPARNQSVLVAPIAGRVTSLSRQIGQRVESTVPLATILPIDAPLVVQLYVSDRVLPFISVGNEVRLRFDAFPFPTFGLYTGRIREITKVPALARDQLGPLKADTNDAVYSVRVDLPKELSNPTGSGIRVEPGMKVRSEIRLEQRHLYQWIVDPILAMRERLR